MQSFSCNSCISAEAHVYQRSVALILCSTPIGSWRVRSAPRILIALGVREKTKLDDALKNWRCTLLAIVLSTIEYPILIKTKEPTDSVGQYKLLCLRWKRWYRFVVYSESDPSASPRSSDETTARDQQMQNAVDKQKFWLLRLALLPCSDTTVK